ncbi:RHS repeat-associated core domain-containing protein [Corallococcus exiguus]|uniref:RHS repeat-associated core domain-containing protein n=1 Tax=Corallococcus TaxID=83461 RepID=UPI0013156F7C|nr:MULTISPECIES: RHS repeat-associated core domain-containing protein [Corallococcus]NNB96512.1 RHS repeat-associated core domain-containing protein [Corallococcus exiguus]NNC03716.1 RHS repeat-associated core domain-containing protein [Corallococcus exiguus]NPC48814.1 RHS repeat-associated core domain-containing protein [Corallococcus exiguus]
MGKKLVACYCDGKPGPAQSGERCCGNYVNPVDPKYDPVAQKDLSICWYWQYGENETCTAPGPGASECNDECFQPPPDCSDGKCACGTNGEKLPSIGDPVNALTGESILVEDDLQVAGSVGTLKLTRHFTSAIATWLTAGLVRNVPKPFGSALVTPATRPSASMPDTLSWWHNYYSFVLPTNSKWTVVKETGAVSRFTPCTGIPCTATPSGGSASRRERLQRAALGFTLTEPSGRKLYFQAKHIEVGSTQERFFLSRIVSPSGIELAALNYAALSVLGCPPVNPGSDAGVPYLASVNGPMGSLDFQYALLTSVDGQPECVVRSVTRRGDSSASITYDYALDSSSVERPGRIAKATMASKVRTYSYSPSSLQASIDTLLVMKHDYASTGAVATINGDDEQLTLSGLTPSTCAPGSNCCGALPQKRTSSDANAGRGDGLTGASGLVRAYETLANGTETVTPRLYQTTDSCTVAGACSPGTERYEWECAAAGLPAYEKARKNKRDFWEVYTYASPAAGTGMPASLLEKTGVKRGAQDMTGTGALEEETFSYTYGPNGEQLLTSSEKASVLGAAGQKARTFNRYDATGRLSATIRSGWTRVFDAATGAWSSQQRWVGTFSLTTRTGDTTADPFGRTVEQHGPCLVASEAATDCPAGTVFPVTRNYYWADTETTPRRNQLQKLAQYPNGLSSTPIETLFNTYDAGGHVTEMVDANGVTFLSTYQDQQLLMQTVRVTGQPDVVTHYSHDPAGNQTYVQLPEGNYEVSCYRQGTTSGCTGGTLTDKRQWKAKSSTASAATWSEKVTYTYWPDGKVNEERYLDASGNTRKVFTYAADAHRRPTWTKTGIGTGSFVGTKSHDAANNLTGEGKPFNAPPAWCAVGSDGQPTSAACTAMQYDGANRLQRIDEHATSGTTTRTCLKHDAHGNLISLDTGLAATTNCATATPSANASRYQYDDFGNMVEATLAATGSGSTAGTTRFAYDALGSSIVKQTPAMVSAHIRDHLAYASDAMGRLLSVSHLSPLVSGGAETLYVQAYDGSISPDVSCGTLANTMGRLRYQDDSFGRTWFSYDAWGRKLKEVRLRTGTTTCSGTPFQNPHTLYAYSPNGNLTQVTYPYGRVVTYNYGTGALTDRIASVSVLKYSSGAPTTEMLLSQVVWEPYGGLRGYRTHYAAAGTSGSVEYALGDNATAAPSSCPSAVPNAGTGDATGRQRALWVSTLASGANFTPGSGNGTVFKQLYTWQADQLVRADSCLLGATSPLTETYDYDGLLRLTSATGTLSTAGGPFTSRAFAYDARGNRSSESGEANSWALAYSSAGHPDWLTSRNSTQTGAQLGYSYTYDADGRVSQKLWRPADAHGNAFHLDFTSGPSSNGGADTVFKSVGVNGLTFNYFYDAQGRRRLKDYPTGVKDEYFYSQSQELLVDQGNTHSYAMTTHPVDEYVWLGGRPVAIIRGKLDTSWAHLSDATADCTRASQAAVCGAYHLITDPLGKPVLTLDEQGRVSGTGEYDAFGHVNRVSVDVETPHPYSTSTSGPFGTVMKQPIIEGTSLEQRVLFDSSDLWSDFDDCTDVYSQNRNDTVSIRDEATSADLAVAMPWYPSRMFTSWFTPSASGTRATLNNTGFNRCSLQGSACVCTGPRNAAKNEQGVVISAYEYRRFQTGASPFWTPLRFPGQYHDAETDLFENWNRYYDPAAGHYLQPESLLQKARVGTSLPKLTDLSAYRYAQSNPTNWTDPDALFKVTGNNCPADLSEERTQECVALADKLVEDPCMKACIIDQCNNVEVQCDSSNAACDEDADAWAAAPGLRTKGVFCKEVQTSKGLRSPSRKPIIWCEPKFNNNRSTHSQPDCYMRILVHEFGHNCGMRHNNNGGQSDRNKGIPGASGNGIEGCFSK